MKLPMWGHFVGITAAAAGFILCTLLPFLPGPYDPLALPLSMMARVGGVLGLLFAPVGAFWIASRYSRPLAGKHYACAITALIVWSLVWAVVSLAAFALGSLSLALIFLALGIDVVVRTIPRLRAFKTAPSPTVAPALYLLVVPVAVFLLQQAVLEPAVEFSRNRAITNSAQLIADIEQYRVTRGHYPPSLLSVNKDYSPGVIGIEKFHYEPSGDAFNLIFEQPASPLGTREFVIYNPRGEQTATSHALDLLQFTPERLERARAGTMLCATCPTRTGNTSGSTNAESSTCLAAGGPHFKTRAGPNPSEEWRRGAGVVHAVRKAIRLSLPVNEEVT